MKDITLNDNHFMQRCIDLAQLGSGYVAPNPMVGAVIELNNEIIGEGYHQKYGEAHAEVHAIHSVEDTSVLSQATIYVSLEPCAHHGKTPPCADLLVSHKFKRVVIGCLDSNELVAGKGIARLQEAGIEVTVGVLEKECKALNKRFFTYLNKQRPYIVLKWAQTQDGYIDRPREEEITERKINWISAPETQSLVHHWRSQEPAILVGWKTVEHDNPSLTVREVSGKNPLRVIIDSQLNMPQDSTIYNDGDRTVIINKIKTETIGNVELIKLNQINTKNILDVLYNLQISSVFVEGGSSTIQHFLVDGYWDEARVIVGKQTFGDGIKGPRISGTPSRTYTFAGDTVHHYVK
jgi:diaminohydroxyphosphoribosylaminopyrimidine deaminase/5-amino-6-(5-phosphoribosylamino)uracil reductase